jgi:hypothetical protein
MWGFADFLSSLKGIHSEMAKIIFIYAPDPFAFGVSFLAFA